MSGSAAGEYTQELEKLLWILENSDYEQDYDSIEILEKLNDPEFLRPFAERLLAFYNDILKGSLTVDEARSDLQRRVKEKDIDLKRGVITNWFTGNTEPKHGDDDRRRMYAIAFALELDVEQTRRLFHKVLLDRAFNVRNIYEFIYLYCISNRKPLSVAESLINQLNTSGDDRIFADQTEQTQLLAGVASQVVSENGLLDYIAPPVLLTIILHLTGSGELWRRNSESFLACLA